MRVRLIAFVVMTPMLASCYKSITGICDYGHEHDERILEVRRIVNATTNAPIPSAIFSDFTVDGEDFSADFAARTGGGPGAEVVSRGAIECTATCKFAFEPHVYGFLVSADGFQPKRVEFAADWMNKTNSCPIILSGATVVEIALTPLNTSA